MFGISSVCSSYRLSNSSIILVVKRALIFLLHCVVVVFRLPVLCRIFLAVPLVGLWGVIMAFAGHTCLLFYTNIYFVF